MLLIVMSAKLVKYCWFRLALLLDYWFDSDFDSAQPALDYSLKIKLRTETALMYVMNSLKINPRAERSRSPTSSKIGIIIA